MLAMMGEHGVADSFADSVNRAEQARRDPRLPVRERHAGESGQRIGDLEVASHHLGIGEALLVQDSCLRKATPCELYLGDVAQGRGEIPRVVELPAQVNALG